MGDIALQELLDEAEIFEMGVYLLVVDGAFEVMADDLDIFSDLSAEELRGQLLLACQLVEFDDVGVVEIADFLEAGLVDVALHVLVDPCELLQPHNDLLANDVDVEFIVGAVQQRSVDVREGNNE